MRIFFYFYILLLLTSCATAPKSPEVAHISFISMELGTVKVAEEMGDYYYNEFDAPGYKVRFESNRKIITQYGEDSFLHLDYFECNSPKLYPEGQVKRYGDEPGKAPDAADQVEIKRLKAELRLSLIHISEPTRPY